jgi:acetyl esterase/lipase
MRIQTCLLSALLFTVPAVVYTAARVPEPDLERTIPVPADQPIPMADFFRPALLQDAKLNFAGTHVAALISNGDDRYRLLAYELATGKMELASGSTDQDIYGFHWLSNDRLMFALSSRKLYGVGYHAVDTSPMGRPYPLLQYTGTLISVPRADRSRPLFWTRHLMDGVDQGVAVINSNNKTGHTFNLLAAGSGQDVGRVQDQNERLVVRRYPLPKGGVGVGYLADRDGELAFAYTHRDGVFTLHRLVGRSWQPCPIDLDDYEVVTVGDEPGQLVVLDRKEVGKPRALRFMDAATGKAGEVILEDTGYDFNGWLYRDPTSRRIVGAIYDRHGPHAVWFDESYQALQRAISALFPGQVARLVSSDDRGRIFLVRTFSDRHPSAYHWVDLEKKAGGLIKASRPWIQSDRMRPMIPLKYKTRDGLSFDAYLTLPDGATKENPPPLIVMPHGGPWVRDTWGFDGEVQYLASRGYAVLQPNYRGSVGYSWMYPDEDEWAFRKMHEDVTDCVKFVMKSGHVDRDRIAIMGGSFGGYLAICGVTFEPDLYRCAVTIAGVFDWAEMIKNSKYGQYDNPRYARLIRMLGDPKQEAEKFEQISPIRQVAAIQVPVFVAHGKDDSVVEVRESRRLVTELQKHRVPHEALFVREEGHGMGRLKNQLELYSRIDRFLQQHLAPAAPATP